MRKDGIMVEHPSCNGTDPTVVSQLTCTVSTASLLLPTFGLVEGDQILATVEALNQIDYSNPSPLAGSAVVQVKPHKPLSPPSRGANNTNETSVEVHFQQVVQNGGSNISAYSIEMDAGLGFVEVANTLVSPVIVSNTNVKSGAFLRFRYRALNVYGWSDYSDVSIIVAATVPQPPT
jgi:hypothetical protein